MKIDDEVLAKLEKLSHLHIVENKKSEAKEQLSSILNYIENLNELDTDAIDASFSTLDGGTPLRIDTPKPNTSISKEILSHAPQAKDDFFIVPAIID